MRVPDDVRMIIGKTQFKKSLKTTDQREAERLAAQIIPLWEREIAAARQTPGNVLATKLKDYRKLIAEMDAAIDRTRSDHEWNELQEIKAIIETEIEDLITSSMNASDAAELSEGDLTAAQLAYKITTGQFVPFLEYLDEYIGLSHVNRKTASEQRRWVTRFNDHVGDLYVHLLQRSTARQFAFYLLDTQCLSPTTIKKALSYLAGYWEFLRDHKGIVNAELNNPFKEIKLPKINSKDEQATKRLPFSVEDIKRIHDHLLNVTFGNNVKMQDKALFATFLLAIYTGGRIEELVRMTVDAVDIEKETLSITGAKTTAGNRIVPIHPKLLPLINDLVEDAQRTQRLYLINTNSKNMYGNRSDPLSKRFGRLKTALGYDSRYVFHSIRKTVVTLLEQAGVPEGTTADLVGHEKTTMTYGLYSGGTSLAQKREAIKKLNYQLD